MDEHRYGLISNVVRVWGLRGFRPLAPYQTKYQWGYQYTALDVSGKHAAEVLYTPTVSKEWTLGFYGQLVETEPNAEHIIIGGREPRRAFSF